MSLPIVIQAHMSSTRLPGKIMRKYKNFTILDILIQRLKKSPKVKKIIIATTKNKKDLPIINYCKKNKIEFFRGSEDDVLERYYQTAKHYKLKNLVRLTSDCPLIDIKTLNHMIDYFEKNKIDFYSNTVPHPCKFPDGADIEIFNFKTLKKSHFSAKLQSEREHVTFFMWKTGKFKTKKYNINKNLSKYRYTVDYYNDFKLICSLIDEHGESILDIDMYEIIDFIKKNPKKVSYQKKLYRTIGWQKSFKKDNIYLKKL